MKPTTTTNNGKPIHPLFLCIPLAAFLLALLGDLSAVTMSDPSWLQWSYRCVAIGLFFTIAAAIPGILEYLLMKMRDFGAEMAMTQSGLSGAAAIMYAADLYLRDGGAPISAGKLAQVMTLEIVGLATVAMAVWLGSQMEAIRKGDAQHTSHPIGKHA